jgi:ankyrin repeat protein
VLQVLLDAGVSRNDQSDKDLALLGAAESGSADAVGKLIAYGANANADFSKSTVADSTGMVTRPGGDVGSVLIYAAQSGNPDVVRVILRYRPDLEKRDRDGKTAIFAAGDYRSTDEEGASNVCACLLRPAQM